MNLVSRFLSNIDKLQLSGKIAVAVSGGADSMALALLTKQWADRQKAEFTALTVDHKLRPESGDEANDVHKWLGGHKINHHILLWEGEKKSANIQAEARNARYKLMADFCTKNSIANLLVAHNKEDQAETVLLRLMRGSGVDGLAGMEEVSPFENIRIVRPLLDIPKRYLREFLEQQGQEWIEDPSNQNPKYKRVEVRQFINNSEDPELLVDRLVATAENMRRSRSYIETMLQKDFAAAVSMHAEGYASIDLAIFSRLHEEAAYRILSGVIKNIGGDYYKPRFEKLLNLYKQIKDEQPFPGCTLGGCAIFSSKDNNIIIDRELAAISGDQAINSPNEFIWDNRFRCQFRGEIPGLTIGALGEQGFLQIKEKIANIKSINIPKKIIYSLPAFKSLEKIIAAPHIGYYANDELKEQCSVIFLY